MKISKKKSSNRKSKIYALFFVKKLKQKEIADRLGISIRTVKRYIRKKKQEDYSL